MKKTRYFVIFLAVLLCLSGCYPLRPMYEQEDADRITQKGTELMQGWLNKNMPGGRTENMYVPFTMMTGMLLDTDSFRNVSVSNGKLINDGDRVAVVGIAFPGLQEDLAISKEKLVHSCVLGIAVKISSEYADFQFPQFLQMWGYDRYLREEDKQRQTGKDGRSYPSLMQRVER